MTEVLLNRTGTDIVDLSVNQTGSSETTVILKDALLSGSKDYRFAVTELSVPLQNIDMFGFLTATQELFTVQRRTYRSTLTEYSEEQTEFEATVVANATDMPGVTAFIRAEQGQRRGGATFVDDQTALFNVRLEAMRQELKLLFSVVPSNEFVPFSTYSLVRGRKFYDVNQFVKSLSDFARVFNTGLLANGTDDLHFGNGLLDVALIDTVAKTYDNNLDVQLLKIFLTCDGNLVFSGDRFFWDNFMIRFTNTGAAILGIDTDLLTDRTLTVTNNIVNNDFTDAQDLIETGGGNSDDVGIRSPVSVFQSAECRIKCTVESHLPVQSSIEVRDETETNNREICSAFFLNNVTVTTNFDSTGSLNRYSLQSKVFAGQFPLIHQNSRIRQWNRLLTAYNLAFFRFFVNVHWRYFDDATGVWKILIKRANIDKSDYWAMKIRFVSDE